VYLAALRLDYVLTTYWGKLDRINETSRALLATMLTAMYNTLREAHMPVRFASSHTWTPG
jgi:hypothetical protein